MARNAVDVRNLMILLALVILLAAGTAYAVYALLGVSLGWRSSGGVAAALGEPGPMLDAGSFTVNLSAGTGPSVRYLRTGIVMELGSPEVQLALEQRMPQVRDRIIGVLREQTMDSLHGSEGMARLKQQLRASVEELTGPGTIVDIYLVDLVVQ
ncbi:MAG: flagellar basal body-associated FliL family protein [Bacillota bacterium]|nr:hypothetical protein [Bacillota bacterium]REJ36033.1 MAG: hypothetical protein DIU82_05985 [Bacillota bacterium]